ncbi:MAG: phenylalanine--tRNA ligase subunit beta [bacterium]
MIVSLNWLKEYTDSKLPINKLVEELTMRSIEVNSVTKLGKYLDKIIIGQVKEMKKHPNADLLNLAKVDIGNKTLEIVCGGKNLKPGQKVAVAQVGAKVNFDGEECKISPTKIRGVESIGMICSAKEIGLSDESENPNNEPRIMVLNDDAPVGTELKKYGSFNDKILDLDIQANRSDLMGHIGIAREIAVLNKQKLSVHEYKLPSTVNSKLPLNISVTAKEYVPRYSALIISGLKNIATPKWMKDRLEAIGQRSINYVVDLTNYLMHDTGQPLHAFDYDRIAGHQMTVREAEEGEVVQTLDGEKRKLQKGMLVITDGKGLIDLAGIMGGKNSEVDINTKTIVLQAAIFDPIRIRKTSRLLGHRTDAVARYEKSVDVTGTLNVLAKALNIIKKDQPGAKLEKIIDHDLSTYQENVIKFDSAMVKKLGGVDVSNNESKTILTQLGMKVAAKQNLLHVTVPSFRSDITKQEDLVEEILRIYGYDKIPETNLVHDTSASHLDKDLEVKKAIHSFLSARGAYEVINYSFVGNKEVIDLGLDPNKHIRITNPIDERQSIMRSELISGLLKNTKDNLRFQEKFFIYELGNTFIPQTDDDVREIEMLAGVCAIANSEKKKGEVFYKAKETIEELLNHLNFEDIRFVPKNFSKDEKSEDYIYHPGRTAEIWAGNKYLGLIAEAHTIALKNFGIKSRVAIFELELEKLVPLAMNYKVYKEISKYPPISLDLAFLLPQKTLISDVKSAMLKAGKPLLVQADLFDEYFGQSVPRSAKSLAFHLYFQDMKKTLNENDVAGVKKNIISELKKLFGATLRQKK